MIKSSKLDLTPPTLGHTPGELVAMNTRVMQEVGETPLLSATVGQAVYLSRQATFKRCLQLLIIAS